MHRVYRSLRLQTVLAVCCSAAVLVVVLLLAGVTMSLLESDLRANAEAAQGALVEATAADIDEKIDQRRRLITTAAQSLRVDPGDANALQAHFDSRPVLRSFFDVMLVLDARGRVIFSAPGGEGRVGRSLADRAHVQRVLATGETVISEPLAGRTTHEPTIVFAAPLRNTAGRVQGVLTGALLLTRANFLGSLATHRIGRHGYFYIATKGERPVLAVHPQQERIMEPVPDAKLNPHLRRALDGFEGTVEGTNSQGLQALYTFRSLTSVPWVLAGAYPSAEAFAPMERRRKEVTVAAFLIAGLAGGVIVVLCTGLMRPLRELRERMVEATAGGEGAGLVTVRGGARDIADIVRAYNALIQHKADAEQALHARERQLRAITDNLPVLISYIDRDRVFRFVNATYAAWFRKPVGEIVDRPVQVLVGTQLAAQREPLFVQAMAGERVEFAHELTLPDGVRQVQGIYIPDLGEDGQVRGIHVLIGDVTEAKANEQRLVQLARHDALTGLPNRRHFEEGLEDAMARARRSGRPLALMLLDVDHFKQINDTRGHAAGDAVLKAFAQRLRSSVRVTDLVARLAGDEFTIVLEGLVWPQEARIVAQKIIDAMTAPVELPDGPVSLSTSIGIAAYQGEDVSPAELLHRADGLLYQAKRAGRGTFQLSTR